MKTNAIFSKKQLFGVCCALLLSPMAVFGQLIVGKSLGADHTAARVACNEPWILP